MMQRKHKLFHLHPQKHLQIKCKVAMSNKEEKRASDRRTLQHCIGLQRLQRLQSCILLRRPLLVGASITQLQGEVLKVVQCLARLKVLL